MKSLKNLFFASLVCILGFSVACSNSSSTPDPDPETEPTERELEIAEWREDLAFLQEQMPIRHVNLYHSINEDDFQQLFSDLDADLEDLDFTGFVAELMRIAAFVSSNGRDGHTGLVPFQPSVGFQAFPLVLFEFSDGLFIVDAASDYQSYVGEEIVTMGGMPIAQVFEAVEPFISKDNFYTLIQRRQIAILIADALHYLGISDAVDQVEIGLASGSSFEISAIDANSYFQMFPTLSLVGFPEQEAPLFVSNLSEIFWWTYIDVSNTVYVQYNYIFGENSEGMSIADFADEISDFLDNEVVDRLVVDVRQNAGGDNTTYGPLVEMLKNSSQNESGDLFVLAGRGTFSAAQNFLTTMENETDAVLVGEPSAGAPRHYGDAVDLVLPNTGIAIGISSRYHQDVPETDDRLTIVPDLAIEFSSTDYFNSVDPVLDAVEAM